MVDAAYARQLAAYGRPLSVHLAVDTGMHRLGEASGHLEEIRQIFALPSLRIQGIYTHLCTADGTTSRDQAYVHRQAQAFRELLERLQNQGSPCPRSTSWPATACSTNPTWAGTMPEWASPSTAC